MVLKVAVLFGLFGLIVSRRQVLDWIAPLSSMNSLVVWYVVFGAFLTILGFWVFSAKWNIKYTIALVMITWAFGIVLYWPISSYSTGITGAHLTGVESATEDAVTFSFLQSLGINDSSGLITYAVVPFLLILAAGWLVAPSMFNRIVRSVAGKA